MKNKFSLPKTSRAPRIQEYHFSLSARCLHYSVEPSVLIRDNFYRVFPTAWLNWVYGRPSRRMQEKKPAALHLDSWLFTARGLEYVR